MTADRFWKTIHLSRLSAWAAVALLAVSLVGCGSRDPVSSATFYPVKGKITLPDGKPLGGTKVIFSGPIRSDTITESDGTFTIKGEKPGLPAGDYAVYLEGNATLKGKFPTLPFPGKYLDEDSSDLKAKVTPEGPNDFDFKLTKGESGTATQRGTGRGPAKVRD
jgi:hypothetical protein